MSKFIDAEKLIAEIERELSAHDKVDHLDAFEVGKAWNRGHRKALENILSLIDSLQQEQPSLPSNLYEAAEKWKEEHFRKDKKFGTPLQKEQPEKYIELNGIKYKEVPAKTNDKICKDCDYFLDNGKCELVDCCPCIDDDTILERLPEQSEVDLEKEIQNYFQGYWPGMETPEQCNIDMHFTPPAIMRLVKYAYELGFNARNEE